MADPIGNAINTFAALQGLKHQGQQAKRQQRLDEENREDRKIQRGLLQEQADWSRTERKRKKQNWSDADIKAAREESDQIILEFTTQMEAAGKTEWGDEETQSLLARLSPVQHGLRKKLADLYDPKTVDKRLSATKNLLYQLKTGDFNHDELLQDANVAFASELDARGQKYGAKQVRFARLMPSPQGDGFVAELEVTKEDGSTYRAPATMNGGTVEDGDQEVKNYKMEEVAPYLIGQLQTLQGAKAYLKSRGKLKDTKRKVTSVGSDKAGRELIDEEGNLVRTLHGPFAGGDGASGSKTERIKLKTGRMVTLDDLRKSYVAAYGKADQFGNLMGLKDGAPNYNDWVNEQATEPVFWREQQAEAGIDVNDPAYAEAKKRAEKWADGEAGYLSTDASDFAAQGGSREQAITQKTMEYYQQLKGGGQMPQASPAAQGLGVPQAQAASSGKAPMLVAGKPAGLVSQGTIDLASRPIVKNADGSISTVRSITMTMDDGKAILIPTVSPDGKILSNDEAVALAKKTGQHLGIFANEANANQYAQSLHQQQEQMYAGGSQPKQRKSLDDIFK